MAYASDIRQYAKPSVQRYLKISVARYHSLAAVKETLPDCLKITAETDDGEIMAVEHKEYPVYGLQFHPESILTKDGKRMMENFINSRR